MNDCCNPCCNSTGGLFGSGNSLWIIVAVIIIIWLLWDGNGNDCCC